MRRLSAEDEKGLRFLSMSHYVSFPGPRLRDVLAEIDALRAERDMFRRLRDEMCARHDALRDDFVALERDNSSLRAEAADAERRGRQLELADVLAWARGRGGQHTNGGTSAAWNHVRSWVAESLESGAHRKP